MPPRRPRPPVELYEPAEDGCGLFRPAPELLEWTRAVFLDSSSKLYSPTHADLKPARIGFLWTNHENVRRGKLVLGDASLAHPPRSLYAWDKAASFEQLEAWFSDWWDGEPADFRIRIYAPFFATAPDTDVLALVKHELLHCRHAVNRHGAPRYSRGLPVWGLRGHDVEAFTEEVEWFGAGTRGGAVQRLVDAAAKRPRAGVSAIAAACGSCLRRVA